MDQVGEPTDSVILIERLKDFLSARGGKVIEPRYRCQLMVQIEFELRQFVSNLVASRLRLSN